MFVNCLPQPNFRFTNSFCKICLKSPLIQEMNEECIKMNNNDSTSSKLFDCLRSIVPNIAEFGSYGPTLDATVLETLQVLDNNFGNGYVGDGDGIFPQVTKIEEHKERLMNDNLAESDPPSGCLQKVKDVLPKITPSCPSIKSCLSEKKLCGDASAMSLLQGGKQAVRDASRCSCASDAKQCIERKSKSCFEGVKNFVSGLRDVDCWSRCKCGDRTNQNGDGDQKPKKKQTLYATTRITIYDDLSRIYEIISPSSEPPDDLADDIDGVFVLGSPIQKRN